MARSLFEQLLKVVEAQYQAARRVDAPGLMRLTRERAMLQDQVSLQGLIGLSPVERTQARATLLKIRELDQRIRWCADTVLSTLSTLLPESAPMVYTARGHFRER